MINLAAVNGVDSIFQLSVAGHQQTNGAGIMLADPFQQLNATLARHPLIGQNHVNWMVRENNLSRLGAVCGVDLKFLCR